MRALCATAFVCAATAMGATTAAAAPERLGVVASSPANGASVSAGQPVTFSVTLAGDQPAPAGLILEVATQDAPGQDGTLANDYDVDYNAMTRSDASPNTWRLVDSSRFLLVPGTYYWQASWTYGTTTYMTDVYAITVAGSQPSLPSPVASTPSRRYVTLAVARRVVRSWVWESQGVPMRRLTCRRVSGAHLDCTAVYRKRGRPRSVRVSVTRDSDGFAVVHRRG